jgi:hypothetical protein
VFGWQKKFERPPTCRNVAGNGKDHILETPCNSMVFRSSVYLCLLALSRTFGRNRPAHRATRNRVAAACGRAAFYVDNELLPAALAFDHRALAIAESLARTFALTFRLGFLARVATTFLFTFAHGAFCAAAILALAAGDIFLCRRPFVVGEAGDRLASIWLSSASKVSIRSLMAIARRS